jgi:TrmH family RNA methyltransferase
MRHNLTSIHHPLVKHLNKLRQDRQYRYIEQSVLIEGLKPIQEMDPSQVRKLVYIEKWKDQLPLAVKEEWMMSEAMMKKLSGMTASEGIIAEVEMPPFGSLNHLDFVLALDGISDPGNMGTLLRTALALGWEGVYILPNSCDPYNDKALRASRGAHFRLQLGQGTVKELQKLVQESGWEPLVADVKGDLLQTFGPSKKRLLVLGNEAHGASSDISRFCSKVTIPMPGAMESLNVAVAGGILMYGLKHIHHLGS